MTEDLQLAIALAERAAEVHRRGREGRLQVTSKSHARDLVTDVDHRAEQVIRELIGESRPGDRVLGEEGGGSWATEGRLWVIDPLDGTLNYAHGFPWYAVSVALVIDGRPEVGVVLDSAHGDLFTANRGGGASRNGHPLAVSPCRDPEKAMLATGFAYDPERLSENLGLFSFIAPRVRGVRRPGAASLDLSWVAAGALDGFWEIGLSPWDVAAGLLIVQEAGGRVTDEFGAPWCFDAAMVVASNGALHEPLLTLLREARAAS